jgi:5'(3')-deoxyribonucleotidase
MEMNIYLIDFKNKEIIMSKKRIFIDMDGVLADWYKGVQDLPKDIYDEYAYRHDEVPGLYLNLPIIEGSVEAVLELNKHFDLFILSTASWGSSSSLTEKVEWIKKLYGSEQDSPFYKKVILTHRKDLLIGDYLIDDREVNGAKEFTGELIQFGTSGFETWADVVKYILSKEGIESS